MNSILSTLISSLLFLIGNGLPFEKEYNKQDMQCKFMTAFFDGTFQNPKDDQKSFDAQFQVRFDNSEVDRRIFSTLQYWNESLSTRNSIIVNVRSAALTTRCYSFNQTCSVPYDANSQYFMFSLINLQPWYYFRLLYQPSIGEFFTINNTVNGCINTLPTVMLPGDEANQPDPSLLKFCACCGEYRPDKSLNCPVSPLQSHTNNKPVPLPSIPKLLPPINTKSVVVSAKQDQLTCNSVTVFYTGIFQTLSNVKVQYPTKFQLKYDIDALNRRVFLSGQQWDKSLNDMSFYYTIYNSTKGSDCSLLQQGCSIHYNEQAPNIGSHIHRVSSPDHFQLFYQPDIMNGFALKNVTGMCTNSLIESPDQTYRADPDWYRVCACCGDYNPDKSLLCPENPWQTHTSPNA
ncbi:hypothetical protein M3Y97_01168300 [Aphelenchoides bicaudatus]|nr:hypothetical protein M3Y97_01168300 [Aphelenchoides bicaudatus]